MEKKKEGEKTEKEIRNEDRFHLWYLLNIAEKGNQEIPSTWYTPVLTSGENPDLKELEEAVKLALKAREEKGIPIEICPLWMYSEKAPPKKPVILMGRVEYVGLLEIKYFLEEEWERVKGLFEESVKKWEERKKKQKKEK